MLTLQSVEKKIEECKRLTCFYDIAITTHENKLKDVKRGKLKFTQISDSALLGLVKGDISRLYDNKNKLLEEKQLLEDQLKSLKTENQEEAPELQTDPLPASEETVPDLDKTLQESTNTLPESIIVQPETSEPSVTPLFEFDTNNFSKDQDFERKGDKSMSTPDLLTDQEIIDTLKEIDNHQDDQESDGPMFP